MPALAATAFAPRSGRVRAPLPLATILDHLDALAPEKERAESLVQPVASRTGDDQNLMLAVVRAGHGPILPPRDGARAMEQPLVHMGQPYVRYTVLVRV